MKSLRWFALGAVLLCAAPANVQTTPSDWRLPVLHKIQRVSLSPSYGCRSEQDFQRGYVKTALFLSAYSKYYNSPELLFNGACGAPDYFEGATAGDDVDVVTDYGDIPLDSFTAGQVFSPQRRTDSVATFAESAATQVGHTYGVLINKSDIRGFFYFRVLAYVPNRFAELEYVVMDYQILQVAAESPGFDWNATGSY